MLENIILYISMISYAIFMKLSREYSLRNILSSNNADEACNYRKKFILQRIIITVSFLIIAITLICMSDNYGMNTGLLAMLTGWSMKNDKDVRPLWYKRPKDIKKSNYILYLRGFSSDDYTTTYQDLAKKKRFHFKFSEGDFIYFLRQYMPVFAVGMTKELESPLGAERIYLNDKTWREEVMELMQEAQLIVISLNDSSSCIWEIQQAYQFKNKVVYIADDKEKLLNIRKEMHRLGDNTFPASIKYNNIAYYVKNENILKQLEFSNNAKSYKQTIKEIMYKKFGLKRFLLSHRQLYLIIVSYAILIVLIGWILSLFYEISGSNFIILTVLFMALFFGCYYTYNRYYRLFHRTNSE